MLQREIKDPRLGMVSIIGVDVTRDMSLAKVFYTLIGSDHNTPEVQEGLKKASGFLRYELGKRVQLRIVPKLDFRYDESVIKGAELSRLIEVAVAEDQQRHVDDE
jgi:ribosome-binding factor A